MTKKKGWFPPRAVPESRYFHWTDHPSINPNPLCRIGGCSNPADPTITDGFSGMCAECAYVRREHNEVMLIPFGGVAPLNHNSKLRFPILSDEELGIAVPESRVDSHETSREMAQVG